MVESWHKMSNYADMFGDAESLYGELNDAVADIAGLIAAINWARTDIAYKPPEMLTSQYFWNLMNTITERSDIIEKKYAARMEDGE